MVEQLVARDAEDPRQRRFDGAAPLQLGDRGEECLLRQVLGHRDRAATVHEVAIHTGQCDLVEPPEAVGVQIEVRDGSVIEDGVGHGEHVDSRVVRRRPIPSGS